MFFFHGKKIICRSTVLFRKPANLRFQSPKYLTGSRNLVLESWSGQPAPLTWCKFCGAYGKWRFMHKIGNFKRRKIWWVVLRMHRSPLVRRQIGGDRKTNSFDKYGRVWFFQAKVVVLSNRMSETGLKFIKKAIEVNCSMTPKRPLEWFLIYALFCKYVRICNSSVVNFSAG